MLAVMGAGLLVGVLGGAPTASAQCEADAQVVAAEVDPDDYFGTGVCVDNDRMIIGASKSDPGTNQQADIGAAYIYKLDSGDWVEVGPIEATSPTAFDDMFGESVAIHDEWAIVSAPLFLQFNQQTQTNEVIGAVYVFKQSFDPLSGVESWDQHQVLLSPNPTDAGRFGGDLAKNHHALAIHGDTLIIGAPKEGVDNGEEVISEGGVVYVFEYDSGEDEWEHAQTLTAATPRVGGKFGLCVDFDGATIVVGEPANAASFGVAGIAHVFAYDETPGEWVLDEELQADAPTTNDWFGFSVAIDGRDLVVGAPNLGGGFSTVFHYEASTSTWDLEMELYGSEADTSSEVGWSAEIDGSIIAIGSRQHEHDTPGINAGAVYVYQRTIYGTDPWGEVMWLLPIDGAGGFASDSDRFGDAVAVAGDEVFVGASGDEPASAGGGSQDGALYIFRDVPSSEY